MMFARGCKLQEDVVLDSGTAVGQNSLIARSVIGTNCQIGNCVTIEDAFIMNNVVIKVNHIQFKLFSVTAHNIE